MFLSGMFPPITTPFYPDGEVYYKKIESNVERYSRTPVAGIVVLGSTGEAIFLSDQERRDVLKAALTAAAPSKVMVAGTGVESAHGTLQLTEYAAELGYDAALVRTPHYYKKQMLPANLLAFYRTVADRSPLPIIIYNFPQATGYDIPAELVIELAGHPNIVAIKESSGSFARMLEHVVNFPGLQRICGADDQALDSFLWGANSWIAGTSNFMPAEHVALYEACVLRKDFAEGLRLMKAMLKMFYLLEQGGKYIQYVKYGVELAGFASGAPRAPLQGLSEAERQQFRSLYEEIKSARLVRAAA